jgi:hypothetical protein
VEPARRGALFERGNAGRSGTGDENPVDLICRIGHQIAQDVFHRPA